MTSLPLSVRTSSIHFVVFRKVCRPVQQEQVYQKVLLTEIITYIRTMHHSFTHRESDREWSFGVMVCCRVEGWL